MTKYYHENFKKQNKNKMARQFNLEIIKGKKQKNTYKRVWKKEWRFFLFMNYIQWGLFNFRCQNKVLSFSFSYQTKDHPSSKATASILKSLLFLIKWHYRMSFNKIKTNYGQIPFCYPPSKIKINDVLRA